MTIFGINNIHQAGVTLLETGLCVGNARINVRTAYIKIDVGGYKVNPHYAMCHVAGNGDIVGAIAVDEAIVEDAHSNEVWAITRIENGYRYIAGVDTETWYHNGEVLDLHYGVARNATVVEVRYPTYTWWGIDEVGDVVR